MGAVLGLCSVAQLACCCGSAACSLCSACPSCANSTSTRLMYTVMLLLVMILACVTLAPGLHDELKKVPFCANSTGLVPGNFKVDCDQAVGYLAVYRICFATCLFFILMALIMIGVRSSKDPRAGIQNGFWGIKYLLLIGGIIGSFWIPQGSFAPTWMVFGMIGGFCFIIIQLILIIDFAHSWAERWVSNYEESQSRGWYAALLLSMLAMFTLTLTGIALLYVYYTKTDGCDLSKFFISINLILVLIASGVSILPAVQEQQPRSGLLQSAVVALYVVYLTWSALSNSSKECNSFYGYGTSSFDKQSITGLIVWACSVLYSSIRTASSSSKITMSEHILAKEGSAGRHGELKDALFEQRASEENTSVGEKSLSNPSLLSDMVLDSDVIHSGHGNNAQANAKEVILGPELLAALGDSIYEAPEYGDAIHNCLAKRWLPLLKKGMTKENKEKLLQDYPIPDNCKLLQSPKLNAEISMAVSEVVRCRDRKLFYFQQQLGVGITAMNRAMDTLLKSDNKIQAVKHLSNSCRLLADLHSAFTKDRIKLITPSLDRNFLHIVQETQRDETLFGRGISEKIKASKLIERQGFQVKKSPVNSIRPKSPNSQRASSRYSGQGWSAPAQYQSRRSPSPGGRSVQSPPQTRRVYGTTPTKSASPDRSQGTPSV